MLSCLCTRSMEFVVVEFALVFQQGFRLIVDSLTYCFSSQEVSDIIISIREDESPFSSHKSVDKVPLVV